VESLAYPAVTLLAGMAMLASLLLLIIPAAPVCLVIWFIALAAALLTGFSAVSPLTLLILTVLAGVGTSAEAWLPWFGLRGKGIGCLSILAFFAGVIVGSLLIPLPFVGGIAGGVAAIVLVQVLELGELRAALRSGGAAMRFLLLSIVVEGIFALLMIIIYFAGAALMAR
jgi:hypothetical protein